jgi:hypothetical protein
LSDSATTASNLVAGRVDAIPKWQLPDDVVSPLRALLRFA